MTKNPLFNALGALLYIIVIVTLMNVGMNMVPEPSELLAPVAMISLFTLSAAVMGYIFCYEPLQLYFDGKKKQAVRLFLQTVLIFAGFTTLIMLAMFSGLFS